jgi:hypothetical protein
METQVGLQIGKEVISIATSATRDRPDDINDPAGTVTAEPPILPDNSREVRLEKRRDLPHTARNSSHYAVSDAAGEPGSSCSNK